MPRSSSFPSICNVIIILNFKESGQSLFFQEASYSAINLPTNNCRERVLEKTVFERVYKKICDTFPFIENNVYYLFYIYSLHGCIIGSTSRKLTEDLDLYMYNVVKSCWQSKSRAFFNE